MAKYDKFDEAPRLMEIDSRISELQDNPTIYEPYVLGKYKAAAGQGFPPPLQKQQA